jgi:hypothetical protein
MSQEPTVLLKAIDAAARRDFAAAAALFAVVDPMDDQVRYTLGLCRFAAGDTDAGLDLMREAFVHGRPGMMPLVPLRVFSEELRAVVSALAASGDAATRLRIGTSRRRRGAAPAWSHVRGPGCVRGSHP